MAKAVDITGLRFGRIVALEVSGKSKGGSILWKCLCDCGGVKNIRAGTLRSGNTKSCGCLVREALHKTHGMASCKKGRPRLYSIWANMKQRCYNPKGSGYSYYGARGIIVCDEWKNDFKAFYDWAVGNGYSEDLTIERINNDGNYEPSNCQWATRKEQSRNTRQNVYVIHDEKRLCLKDVANLTGIDRRIISYRLNRGLALFDRHRPGPRKSQQTQISRRPAD